MKINCHSLLRIASIIFTSRLDVVCPFLSVISLLFSTFFEFEINMYFVQIKIDCAYTAVNSSGDLLYCYNRGSNFSLESKV